MAPRAGQDPAERDYRRLSGSPQVWLAVAPDGPAGELARIENVLARAFTPRSTIDRVLIRLAWGPQGWRVVSAWAEGVSGERAEASGLACAMLRLAGVPIAEP
jgi:hypothetical protein